MNSPFSGRAASAQGATGSDAKAQRDARHSAERVARMRRGMFLLPSLFTAGNIGAGYFAITQTIEAVDTTSNISAAQHLDWAAIAICLAIPFDSLDGRIARMTHTTSDFGKELDSLADAVTFGVAPSLLAFVWGLHSLPDATINHDLRQTILQVGSFVCFLFLLCGVSRLARFNISNNPQPRNPGRLDRKYFVGMPIPAAAGMVAATVHFCYGYPIPQWWLALLWIGLVALLGFLMVSTWRFWSGKEINLGRKQPFQLLALFAIVLFVVIRFSSGALFTLALIYMFSGIWARAAYSWSRRRRHGPRGGEPQTAAAFAGEYSGQEQEPDEQRMEYHPDGYAPAEPRSAGPRWGEMESGIQRHGHSIEDDEIHETRPDGY